MAPNDRPIFILGFMGSGKTTVGRLVADRLGWNFLDLDDLVVQREGRSIEQIFRDSGEAVFRRAEREALETLETRKSLVVASGGGLCQGASNRRWLAARGNTIWLDVPLFQCVRRVGRGTGRPLWDPDSDPEAFRALFEKRRVLYALTGARIPGSGPPEEVVAELLRRLHLSFP